MSVTHRVLIEQDGNAQIFKKRNYQKS